MADAPTSEDTRHDDLEFNPQLEPKKSRAWLNLLEESEDAFEPWNTHCDKIEKAYANLEKLADNTRDKQFQMFWANMEVIKPTIYAKAPIPVVVAKFKDRRPVYQAAAELLERVNVTAFGVARINDLMKQVRDDLAMTCRGVVWCRYEAKRAAAKSYFATERVCYDFKHRRDFLHGIARNWSEVPWVAAASYMTRAEARERFNPYSGDAYQNAEYTVDRDGKEVGGADNRERAKFWEVWDKVNQRVLWVAKGCEDVLDEDDPHLDLTNFFPCPQPSYGTVQPGSLVPVPDVLQWRDQLDELNTLTSKIHAMSEALELKGFYPAGGAEVGPAIEAALATKAPGRVMIPISNWSAFGASKEVVIWMPIDQVMSALQGAQSLRAQIVQDIYQIMGLSDIMRGSTDPNETLGAQQMKSEYGSVRVRDKQEELVRLARDLVEITSDIICDKFSTETIVLMSQTQLPTKRMAEEQAQQLAQQLQGQSQALQMIQTNPQIQQQLQQSPDYANMIKTQGQQLLTTGQTALQNLLTAPTLDQVMVVLRDERARSFILDIETDSTVMVEENTEKQRRTEFTGMVAQLLPQLSQLVTMQPLAANFAGEFLKFACAPFRISRSLDGAIDGFVAQMEQTAQQPKGDDPTTATNKTNLQIEQMKNQRQQQKDQADVQLAQQELQQKDQHAKLKITSDEKIAMAKLQQQNQDNDADAQKSNLELMQSREAHSQSMLESNNKMREGEQKMALAAQAAQQRSQERSEAASDRRAQQQFKMMQPQGAPRPGSSPL